MQKTYKLLCALFLGVIMILNVPKVMGQFHEIIVWDSIDTWIDEGAPSTNRGQSWNLQTNYTGGAGISRFGLVTWDLQWLVDSVPSGQELVYAEMLFNLTNTTPPKEQGLNVIYLSNDNFDGWIEGIGWEWKVDEEGKRIDGETEDPGSGITWGNMQNQFIFLHPLDSVAYHDTLFSQDTVPGKGGGPRTFDVTSLVQRNMIKSDKLITIMLTGFNDESEEFLGWYSQEADWPDPRTDNPFTADASDDISQLAPRIRAYYGTPEYIFNDSDSELFGNKKNYVTYPKNPMYYWIVEDFDLDNKIIKVISDTDAYGNPIDVKTASGNTNIDGLGAQLIWNKRTYTTFNVSFKAQLEKADPIMATVEGQDLAFIFDWEDENTYSCFLFDRLDNLGGFVKIVGGKRALTEGGFGFVNSSAEPKYDDLHLYEIIRNDTSIIVMMDGAEFATTTTATFVSGSGKIGLGSLNNQVFFDDFKETSVSAIADSIKPSTPTGFNKVDVTKSSITLSWNPSTDNKGVDSYLIYVVGGETISVKDTIIEISDLQENIKYSFQVSAIDLYGNESLLSDYVTVITGSSTSAPSIVINSFSASDVKLYPNPANDKLTVNSKYNIASIAVYNVVGKKVLESNYFNNKQAVLDISKLDNGVYFLQVTGAGNSGMVVSKFSKLNL